ncbi:hypothetical protein A3195_00890 [Candidatus Thiodiazotropha endoloripes]|uniref:c-type cytochrome n=1 Tax=Candidatus Thiodiazotropha endoloripes TaxID=1818881 RepID=UPI00083D7E70|nr:c-type cytochrome [Candidatus Thiodiazotropha endoloripes]MCG7904118.1 c-type cytochrome [Candidatus Thiodiazotropha weberae]ODB90095.1 hypothetical protein A3195_00890 [Candidatus Thiodiazotropha endoloripes]
MTDWIKLSATLLFCIGLIIQTIAVATSEHEDEEYYLALGGRAYDNWMNLIDKKERKQRGLSIQEFHHNHPLYPAAGKKRGLTTWRCKECHGWDYLGNQGAYGSGSHYTGIKGIRDMQGASLDSIAAIIRGDSHGYDQRMIDDDTLSALALFISRGQVDMNAYIDRDTGKAKGTPGKGKPLYNSLCAICHGTKGRKINFKTFNKPEFVGTVANRNPWEVLHKIRNGHPGEQMISVLALNIQQQVDILRYSQELPKQ